LVTGAWLGVASGGGSLGLAILVAVFAAAGSNTLHRFVARRWTGSCGTRRSCPG
jgi:hypothetical protein